MLSFDSSSHISLFQTPIFYALRTAAFLVSKEICFYFFFWRFLWYWHLFSNLLFLAVFLIYTSFFFICYQIRNRKISFEKKKKLLSSYVILVLLYWQWMLDSFFTVEKETLGKRNVLQKETVNTMDGLCKQQWRLKQDRNKQNTFTKTQNEALWNFWNI